MMNRFNENPEQLAREFNLCHPKGSVVTVDDGFVARQVRVDSAAYVMAGCAVFTTEKRLELVINVSHQIPYTKPQGVESIPDTHPSPRA